MLHPADLRLIDVFVFLLLPQNWIAIALFAGRTKTRTYCDCTTSCSERPTALKRTKYFTPITKIGRPRCWLAPISRSGACRNLILTRTKLHEQHRVKRADDLHLYFLRCIVADMLDKVKHVHFANSCIAITECYNSY